MDSGLGGWLLIGALLLLSFVFSGSETALLVLGETGVQRLIEEKKPPPKLLLLWRDRPNAILTTILIANNLVNILASAVATKIALSAVSAVGLPGAVEWAMAIAVGAMTFLIVTFGEIVPKTFARLNADRFLSVFPLVFLFYWILRPFSSGLERVTSRLTQALGGKDSTDPAVAEAELKMLIRLRFAQGTLSGEKKELLSSVIEFSETMTKEIMVPRTDVVGFPVDASLEEVLKTVAERKYSRYPVYDGDLDSVIGILTVKDLLRFLSEGGKSQNFSLRDLVSPKVLIVPETKKIGDLLKDFQAQRVQMAVAVDEFGGTAGIVTTEDVIEEIVGEIYDEYEPEKKDIVPDGPGRYIVLGRAPIETLSEVFGVELPDQDNYETVGGLVVTQAGRLPQVGETVDFAGMRFEVRERTRTRILKIAVTRIDEERKE